ncbi:MAG: hypothetical protein R3Y64_09395 [Peptostreptococcaceae bacterium]
MLSFIHNLVIYVLQILINVFALLFKFLIDLLPSSGNLNSYIYKYWSVDTDLLKYFSTLNYVIPLTEIVSILVGWSTLMVAYTNRYHIYKLLKLT